MIYQMIAPHFVAGIIIGPPNICAPILAYMKNWSREQILRYCQKKGWQCLEITPHKK